MASPPKTVQSFWQCIPETTVKRCDQGTRADAHGMHGKQISAIANLHLMVNVPPALLLPDSGRRRCLMPCQLAANCKFQEE